MLNNSMCPIFHLKKNYLNNYVELKNTCKAVSKWQNNSWSGNCIINNLIIPSWRLIAFLTPQAYRAFNNVKGKMIRVVHLTREHRNCYKTVLESNG